MEERAMDDRFEIEISTLLDGELSGEEMRLAVDALVERDDLRDFWKQSRKLDRNLKVRRGGETEPASEEVWNHIERQAGLGRARVIPMPRMTTRAWAAAASLFLILGLSAVGVWQTPSPAGATEKTVQLGSNEGGMSEERFIELTTELLQADSRYHRKMLEVMEVVNEKAYSRREGSSQFNQPRSESLADPQAQPEVRTASREGNPERSSGDIELNLW